MQALQEYSNKNNIPLKKRKATDIVTKTKWRIGCFGMRIQVHGSNSIYIDLAISNGEINDFKVVLWVCDIQRKPQAVPAVAVPAPQI